MSTRLEVALPAAVTFVFGLAVGLVVGHVIGSGGQVHPVASSPPRASAPPEASGQAPQDEAQARKMLAVHEKLLAEKADDMHLLRTVGNYQEMLGQDDEALAHYIHAEEVGRKAGPSAELAQVLVDEAVVRANRSELAEAFKGLEEAAVMDPKDVRSRLSQVYLYLTRVMPSPPPGFDRREAVKKAEALTNEVLAIDPTNADALQFKQLMDSVRSGMRRPASGSGDAAPAGAPLGP